MARILLIDSENQLRRALRQILEQLGHIVYEAPNGSVGLEICTCTTPELVITDIDMPVLNGLQTIARLRRWGMTMPIIAITGGDPPHVNDLLKLALDQGADMAVSKPVSPDRLKRMLDRLMPGCAGDAGQLVFDGVVRLDRHEPPDDN